MSDHRRVPSGVLLRRVVLPLVLLAVACGLRIVFFSGFVLCDDLQELDAAVQILARGPNLRDQFHLRFGGWLFNVLAFRLLGISETSFFLPTVLMSASAAVVAYGILLAWEYPVLHAFAAGVMIAAAPFEVLVGGLRANDVILAWLLAGGLGALVVLERRPITQGIVLAALFWLGFYVKLWVVYVLPALGLLFLRRGLRDGRWRAGLVFAGASVLLHGATCLVWKARLGAFLPFVEVHAATYPVARADLPNVFLTYPRMLFRGSDLGTTLFGSIPWLLLIGLAAKTVGTLLPSRARGYRLDGRDAGLLLYYGSFFLLLEFFPNTFKFDQFYSVPRIFRYLTPLSFPITLHVAKMVLDLARMPRGPWAARWLPVGLLAVLTAGNVAQSVEATRPTAEYRRNLMAAVRDIRAAHPPRLVAEYWIGYFLRAVYLKDIARTTQVVVPANTYAARDYERWLRSYQARLPQHTMLLTGIGSCVHYGGVQDGFRLERFERPLDAAWKLRHEYGTLEFLPIPERVRLWELSEAVAAVAPAEPVAVYARSRSTAGAYYLMGVSHAALGENEEAHAVFESVVPDFPAEQGVANGRLAEVRVRTGLLQRARRWLGLR